MLHLFAYLLSTIISIGGLKYRNLQILDFGSGHGMLKKISTLKLFFSNKETEVEQKGRDYASVVEIISDFKAESIIY